MSFPFFIILLPFSFINYFFDIFVEYYLKISFDLNSFSFIEQNNG